jgi:hypothetical protein
MRDINQCAGLPSDVKGRVGDEILGVRTETSRP